MKIIKLNKGHHAIVDDDDHQRLMAYTWWVEIDPRTPVIYVRGKLRLGRHGMRRNVLRSNPKVRMHEVVMNSTGREIDHRDHNGLNNQKSNLRFSTRQQQMANTRRLSAKKKTPFKGVEMSGVRWRASIRVNGHHIHLGCFASSEEAALAYDQAARQHFGEFAYTNFPIRHELIEDIPGIIVE